MRAERGTAVPHGAAVLAVLAVIGVLGLVAAGLSWHAEGGRWFVVSTPSMGRELPVGTFLVTSPATVAETRAGDVVTFRSPDSGKTFTHRVVDAGPEGLATRGDVNAVDDAWRITDAELVGAVVWHAPVLGWAAKAVPLLALALTAVWLATRWLRPSRRHALRQAGVPVAVGLVSWWLSPWVGLSEIGRTAPGDGEPGVLLDVIATGVLPVRVAEVDGPAEVDLVTGEVGTLHLTGDAERGAFDVASGLDLSWWGWGLLALCCLAPLLWTLVVGLPPVPDALSTSPSTSADRATEDDARPEGPPGESSTRADLMHTGATTPAPS